MVVCKHPDCGYKHGWVKRGGNNNVYLTPPEGEFYTVGAGAKEMVLVRFYPEHTAVQLYGCPKCGRVFISDGEEYER